MFEASAPYTPSIATRRRKRASAVWMLSRIQVSIVCESHSSAFAARQGFSGTCDAIWLASVIAASSSTSDAPLAGGMSPL